MQRKLGKQTNQTSRSKKFHISHMTLRYTTNFFKANMFRHTLCHLQCEVNRKFTWIQNNIYKVKRKYRLLCMIL